MLRLPILILLQSFKYTKPDTTRYITYYWKTTAETDKVFDYWAHGPVYIPGHKIYTMSSKAVDVFPPWLTRRTTQNHFMIIGKTTTQVTTPKSTIVTTSATTSEATKPAKPTLTTENVVEIENEGPTDPFSVFLRNLLRILSVKSLPELPVLVKPFTELMTKMINDRKFEVLGDIQVQYLQYFIANLRDMLPTPDKLRTQCYQFYHKLTNRQTLDKDIDTLLVYLDDMYVEAEEEHMQRVLHKTLRFPNNNATADEIVYDFIYEVFYKPLLRIKGTTKGKTLISMLHDVILKKNTPARHRRHFIDPHSIKASIRRPYYNNKKVRSARKRYETLKSNIEHINNLIHNLDIPSSESDTSVDYDEEETKREEDDDKEELLNIKSEETIKNNHIQKSSQIMPFDADKKYNISYRTGHVNSQNNIINIIETYEKLKNVFDDTFVDSMKTSKNFRGAENTILVPNHPLLTRIIKKKIPYETVTSSRKKQSTKETTITDTTTFTDDEKPDLVTKPIIKLLDKSKKKPTKNITKKDEKLSLKLSARINKLQKKHHKHRPKLFNSKITSHNKHPSIYRFKVKKNRPDSANNDEQTETTQPYENSFIKLLLGAITKPTHESEGTKSTVNVLRDRMTQTTAMEKKYKSKTKRNKNRATSLESDDNYYVDDSSDEKIQVIQEKILLYNQRESIKDQENEKRPTKRHKDEDNKDSSEHDSDESYEKRKYEDLKRNKYDKLKEILQKKEIKHDECSASVDDLFSERQVTNFESDKKSSEENRDSPVSTNEKLEASITSIESDSIQNHNKTYYRAPKKLHERVGVDEINLFLDDYEAIIEDTDEIQEKNDYDKIVSTTYDQTHFRRFFPRNTTRQNSDISCATEHTNGEMKLKANIYDASRRRDDDIQLNEEDGPETDNEAVLKMNIYKAVKKLLK